MVCAAHESPASTQIAWPFGTRRMNRAALAPTKMLENIPICPSQSMFPTLNISGIVIPLERLFRPGPAFTVPLQHAIVTEPGNTRSQT